MPDQYPAINEQEQKAIITLCILAAFADGASSEFERNEVRRIAQNFGRPGFDLTGPYQEALAGKLSLPSVCAGLQSANGKALAYEMAVCICEVDQALSSREQKFLSELREHLKLDGSAASEFERVAAGTRDEPPVIASGVSAAPAQTSELDELIRERAILAGALELLPQRLATMAIVPVQMRTVYQIGKAFGYELDITHTREFLATVGIGLTSQVVESYVSKLFGNVTRRLAGGFLGSLADHATQSVFAFATTYALGQVAKSYYQSGRTLNTGQLRDLFSKMLQSGQSLQSGYAAQIAQRAGTIKLGDFLPLVKS